MESLNIFISYAKDDYNLMRAIEFSCNQINTIKFSNKIYKINVWSDHHLIPGDAWKKAIVDKIKDADVVLLLISPNFIKSQFIEHTELPLVLKRKEESEIGVLGIYLAECELGKLAVRKDQLIPSFHGRLKAISTWDKDPACWDAVKVGIEMCAHYAISRMPWNKGLSNKLPPKLQEKNFKNNAPPALQFLLQETKRKENLVKARAEAKRQNEENDRNEAVMKVALVALVLMFLYYKFIM
jgi:TIR domain